MHLSIFFMYVLRFVCTFVISLPCLLLVPGTYVYHGIFFMYVLSFVCTFVISLTCSSAPSNQFSYQRASSERALCCGAAMPDVNGRPLITCAVTFVSQIRPWSVRRSLQGPSPCSFCMQREITFRLLVRQVTYVLNRNL